METIPTTLGKKLLVSGFWGISRHPNYLGDIIIQLCWVPFVLWNPPTLTVVFSIVFLMQRAIRDNARCKQKYGSAWDRYCTRVKYVLIPKVYWNVICIFLRILATSTWHLKMIYTFWNFVYLCEMKYYSIRNIGNILCFFFFLWCVILFHSVYYWRSMVSTIFSSLYVVYLYFWQKIFKESRCLRKSVSP